MRVRILTYDTLVGIHYNNIIYMTVHSTLIYSMGTEPGLMHIEDNHGNNKPTTNAPEHSTPIYKSTKYLQPKKINKQSINYRTPGCPALRTGGGGLKIFWMVGSRRLQSAYNIV